MRLTVLGWEEGAVAGMDEQQNWGSGGVGWIRDSLAWWRDLNRRGREGPGGREGNRTGTCESDFPASEATFCKRAPIRDHPPLGTQCGGKLERGLLRVYGDCLARSRVYKKSPSRVCRENSWGKKNSDVGMEVRNGRVTPPLISHPPHC